jgi:hypothetical protein
MYDMPPLVWRLPFQDDIATEVVTIVHPHGKVTNSDLELAAEVLAIGTLLAVALIMKQEPLSTLCNNTPMVSWIEKMASKSLSPTAGRLLRGLAFLLHSYHSGRLTTVHVPGKDNIMADIASRSSKAHALFCCQMPMLSDPDFTLAFDCAFPLPTQQWWRLAMVPIWLKSNIFETLHGKQLDLRRWTAPHGPATGKLGSSIAGSTPTTIAGTAYPQPTLTTCSSHLLLPCGKESSALDVRSRFNPSLLRSAVLPKNLFWTDIPTPIEPPQPNMPLTSPLHAF